ncbi:MAG: hydroxymethylpyrimidine/phosphomethylpyrimidine kinase [candidate division WOR-3 bacterium]
MKALSIAGFDPTGEAGILRDLSIFNSFGIACLAIPTALTVQSSRKVFNVFPISTKYIKDCLKILGEIEGIKIGMLYNEKVVNIISDFLKEKKPRLIVLDPIINSSSGYPLISGRGIKEMKKKIIPKVTFITPNLKEAELLTSEKDPEVIAKKIHSLGAKYVVITGVNGRDDLFYDGKRIKMIKGSKMRFSFHGSGCFYSSFLLSQLILGIKPFEAAKKAKRAIENYAKSLL